MRASFSALQRAEIAEIPPADIVHATIRRFSALQRAEIAEIELPASKDDALKLCFSALQRAEIAEIPFRKRCEPLDKTFQCSSTSRNC